MIKPMVPPRKGKNRERERERNDIFHVSFQLGNSVGQAPPPPVPYKPAKPSYKLKDFQLIKVLGKGSFGKVSKISYK